MSPLRTLSRSRTDKPAGVVGKVFMSFFFLLFLAAGCFFFYLMYQGVRQTYATYSWTAVPATVVESDVLVEPPGFDETRPYLFTVTYEYKVGGKLHRSTNHQDGYEGHRDYADADALRRRYAAGAAATAYVNPANPADAVLERKSPWGALALGFPLIFIFIGAGGIYGTWMLGGKTKAQAGKAPGGKTKRFGRLGLTGFFAIFLAAGLGFLIPFFILPAVGILSARQWVATPFTVENSAVRTHHDSDGNTYHIDILYRYEFNGQTYRSSRYQFKGGSSSGRSGKSRVVNAHPVGHTGVCYVNPNDPSQAVIERGWTNDLWFGLIPLVFVVVGGGGIIGTFVYGSDKKRPGREWLPKSKAEPVRIDTVSPDDEPVTLKPTTGRIGKFIGSIVFAVFWNGITSVFVSIAVSRHLGGDPEWFLTFFIIPFVLIGLGLIGYVFYSFLALFNPRVQLTINRAAVPLGEPLLLDWTLTGAAGRLRSFKITLEGREEATYQRGTNTVTDKHTFATLTLTELTDAADIMAGHGRAELVVPADTMHSFVATNNKIVWTLKAHGQIARWPDVKDEFPIVIAPQRHG